jgi:putative two-component system protein, hydrogenase maturation factor HypX/HoxX
VILALAADLLVGRDDIVLSPYYQHMGGLFGSEYWTYLLPRRIGVEMTARIVGAPFLPVGARQAVEIGLLDHAFGDTLRNFQARTRELARSVADDPGFERRLEQKRRRRAADERSKPLQAYRDEELTRCYECFFGLDPSYHRARQRFVHKLPAPQLTVVPSVAEVERAA